MYHWTRAARPPRRVRGRATRTYGSVSTRRKKRHERSSEPASRRQWFDQGRPVLARRRDARRHGVGHQHVFRAGPQTIQHQRWIGERRIEPEGFGGGIEDDGHPIMDTRDEPIGFRGDDGTTRPPIRAGAVEASEADEGAIVAADIHGLPGLAPRHALPLIEAIGRDDAAAACNGAPEEGALAQRFGTRIDWSGPRRCSGCPGRPEALGHCPQETSRSALNDDGYVLARRDIVRWIRTLGVVPLILNDVEPQGDLVGGRQRKTPAHRATPSRAPSCWNKEAPRVSSVYKGCISARYDRSSVVALCAS